MQFIDKIFTDNRNKPKWIPIVLATIIILIGSITVIAFVSSGNENSNANLKVDQDIPKKNENVNLERSEDIKYITRNEMDKILDQKLNNIIKKVSSKMQGEIDMEYKNYVDMVRREREEEIAKLQEKIKNKNKKIEELEKRIKSVERMNNIIRQDKNSLEDKFAYLEEEINKLSNKINNKNLLNTVKNNISSNTNESSENKDTKKIIETENKKEKIKIHYSGIISSNSNSNNKVAMINVNNSEYMVTEGEKFYNFKLKEIRKNEIVIIDNGKERIIMKGE